MLAKYELDIPREMRESMKLSDELEVEVLTSDFCKCTREMWFAERCKACLKPSQQQSQEWNII